ncbi:MAG: EamA family transporter [Clostridiales bacterium]|nr:EamA family transporter [Clostridiales bacterium]
MWIFVAVLSAVFAGLTAILSKCGIKKGNSDVEIAVRISVVFLFSWIIVLITGAYKSIADMSSKALISILVSGFSTGACWICYFKALSIGDASKVAAVDKSSVALSVLLAIIIFPDERALWWVKLICLAVIIIGTMLMTDIKRGDDKKKIAWLIFALLSAIFSTATSLLGKIGTEGIDSGAATALRTCVILVMAWLIVFCKREVKFVKELGGKEILFIVLSGISTGANWFCYYYAIQKGQVSVVVPIDKMSILVTVVFSLIVFKEKLSAKAWIGFVLLTAGTICMAVFT